MNARQTAQETPDFLRKKEPDAIYGWYSTGRLVILKADRQISLSADDLANLRRFCGQFGEDDGAGGGS